ncbi:MAG: hypothetical protein INR71_16160, partial [Terriglobus roseus]|nr:hypothetical protein [Terriglobus roseus]
MRLTSLPAAAFCAVAVLLSSPSLTSASPLAVPLEERDDSLSENSTLVERSCANPCGWSGQLCCESGQSCITNSNNQAECVAGSSGGGVTAAGSGGGYWATYTTTWVETGLVTRTAIYSSYVGGGGVVTGQSAPTGTPQCDYAADETPCGGICCASGQYCYAVGQCVDAGNGGYTTDEGGATVIIPGGTFSAPLRPTTGTFTVVTATVSPTTTVPFQTPVATGETMLPGVQQDRGGGGGGLS